MGYVRIRLVREVLDLNTCRSFLFDWVDRVGILDRFAAIVTAADVSRPKPDFERVLKPATACGIQPSELLVVGDSHRNMQAPAGAGAGRCAAVWGFLSKATDEAELEFARPADVLEALANRRCR